MADDGGASMENSSFTAASLSPRLLKSFRRPILEKLRDLGAASVPELLICGVRLQGVPFIRSELIELLDSARRHELVAPLRERRRLDGSLAPDPEWVLTSQGRREISGFGTWTVSLSSQLGGVLRTITPIAVALGIVKVLGDLDASTATIVTAAEITLVLVWASLTTIWKRARGAPDDEVIANWQRLARDGPLYQCFRERDRAARWTRRSLFAMYAPLAPFLVASFGGWNLLPPTWLWIVVCVPALIFAREVGLLVKASIALQEALAEAYPPATTPTRDAALPACTGLLTQPDKPAGSIQRKPTEPSA